METGITVPLNMRAAWNIETGEKVMVDDRTFNPEWHTLEEPVVEEKKDDVVVDDKKDDPVV